MRKTLILCLGVLAGCTSHEEVIQKIQEEYSALNCKKLLLNNVDR
ncbi:hypothetical protein FACS189449_13240 [Alphaproteobacteria bacterium]|nr:hypothetical protein FACS189449_13240 [Alphaproteobacteria bacterium]